MGGVLGGSGVSTELASMLAEGAEDYTWVAATTGAQNAASYQLATGDAVMALGGFNGTAASPTLAQFQAYVADGRIHYFIGTGQSGAMRGMRGGQGSSSQASQIATWVSEHFTAQTVDGVTVYDLTHQATSTGSTASTAGTRGVNA
jgi:hypothetical protein